jgi:hypothetical protein
MKNIIEKVVGFVSIEYPPFRLALHDASTNGMMMTFVQVFYR